VEVQVDAPEIMGMDFVVASLPCVVVFEGGVVEREADWGGLGREGVG